MVIKNPLAVRKCDMKIMRDVGGQSIEILVEIYIFENLEILTHLLSFKMKVVVIKYKLFNFYHCLLYVLYLG